MNKEESIIIIGMYFVGLFVNFNYLIFSYFYFYILNWLWGFKSFGLE